MVQSWQLGSAHVSDEPTFLIGMFGIFLLLGVLGVLKPYKTTKFFEQLQAIGSRRSSKDVEPTDWNVKLSRIAAAVTALISLVVLYLMLTE